MVTSPRSPFSPRGESGERPFHAESGERYCPFFFIFLFLLLVCRFVVCVVFFFFLQKKKKMAGEGVALAKLIVELGVFMYQRDQAYSKHAKTIVDSYDRLGSLVQVSTSLEIVFF